MAKKGSIKWYIIGAAGLLLLVLLVGYFKNKNKKEGIEVEIEKVEKRTIKELVTASGKVFPETEVKISSDVSGEVMELYIQEGDSVTKGQVLARIDPDAFNYQVERAEAQLNASRSQYSNAKANIKNMEAQLIQSKAQYENVMAQYKNAEMLYERNKKLADEGVISAADLDQFQSNFEALQANLNSSKANIASAEASLEAAKESAKSASYSVESSEASLNEMKTSLRRTTIHSPISGIISKLSVEKGERVVGTIQMSGTEMMRIANLNMMETKVEVSENDVVKVKLGDEASIEVDAYPDRKFKGEVVLIANSSSDANVEILNNDQVTNFYVTIRILPESYEDLVTKKSFPFRPGMSASVEINTAQVKDQLSVPIQAVTLRDLDEDDDKDAEEVVFVKSGDTVIVQPVEIGIQDDRYIAITKGLTEQQEIVSGPYSVVAKELKKGSAIQPKSKDKKEE